MENFTNSISDDFSVLNGTDNVDKISDNEDDELDGTSSSALTDLDIEALLNRTPIYRHRRSRPLEEAPEFVKRLSAFEEVQAGSDVVFECQWKALPRPSVHWYRDDEDITDSEPHCHCESDLASGIERLTVEDVGKSDEGAYKCKVENQEGVASTTGYLSVTGYTKDKPLSSQPRKTKPEHSVSSAPHLRTIVEQKSVEEREAAGDAELSPLQDFIDNFRRENARHPLAPGCHGNADNPCADDADSGSDTSVESQDYDRLSPSTGNRRKRKTNNSESAPYSDNTPIDTTQQSLPDTMDVCSSQKVQRFLDEQTTPEVAFQATSGSQPPCACAENDAQTPTNFLDELRFPDAYRQTGDAQLHDDDVIPDVTRSEAEPRSTIASSDGSREISPTSAVHAVAEQSSRDIPPPINAAESREIEQNQALTEKHDEIRQVLVDSRDDMLDDDVRSNEASQVSTDLVESREMMAPRGSVDLREIPRTITRVFADQLELPWVYYLLFITCCAAFAAGTEMPVPYFILTVAVVSLISFRFLCYDPNKDHIELV